MSAEGLKQWWRELMGTQDLVRAIDEERRAHETLLASSVSPALRAQLDRFEHAPSKAVEIGTLVEPPLEDRALRVALSELYSHLLVLGESGSGKTYWLLSVLGQLLFGLRSLIVVDMKGELVELLTERVLPTLALKLSSKEANALLDRIVIVNPFNANYLPPLNVLVRDPTIDLDVQALDVSEAFETATEENVSLRMGRILAWVLRLVIGLDRGYSFEAVRRVIEDPLVADGLVRSSSDMEARRFFLTRFRSEPPASKAALLARIDKFLALPVTRLALGARQCLAFEKLLDRSLVIVSLGGAPAGLASIARFFGMILLTRFIRAIARRPVQGSGPPGMIVCDEFQLALTHSMAAEFETVLASMRSRNFYLWLAHQQTAQLHEHGPALRSIVLGQTGRQVVFRVPPEDARHVRHLLPTTGVVAAPRGSAKAYLDRGQELDHRSESLSKLPKRHAYFFMKGAPWDGIPFRSNTLELAPASKVPRDLFDRATQGTIAFRPDALAKARAKEASELDAFTHSPLPKQPSLVPARPPVMVQTPTPTSHVSSTPTKPKRRRRRKKSTPTPP
ncbi:MAG: type IV secretory system conjugative DNA transfer family protein [Myxococcales bacterium]|nr:type IV secretory system conjugative DNA transfer family protein [Myxococcales bacterium]